MSVAITYLCADRTDWGDPNADSLELQRQACRRRAYNLGALVTEEFMDGSKDSLLVPTSGLVRMLEFVAVTSGVDYVIVNSLDRFTNDIGDAVRIRVALANAGVELVSVTEDLAQAPLGRLLDASGQGDRS
jgi:DNA invertase Pin-like site-specific DNA recombinase